MTDDWAETAKLASRYIAVMWCGFIEQKVKMLCCGAGEMAQWVRMLSAEAVRN